MPHRGSCGHCGQPAFDLCRVPGSSWLLSSSVKIKQLRGSLSQIGESPVTPLLMYPSLPGLWSQFASLSFASSLVDARKHGPPCHPQTHPRPPGTRKLTCSESALKSLCNSTAMRPFQPAPLPAENHELAFSSHPLPRQGFCNYTQSQKQLGVGLGDPGRQSTHRLQKGLPSQGPDHAGVSAAWLFRSASQSSQLQRGSPALPGWSLYGSWLLSSASCSSELGQWASGTKSFFFHQLCFFCLTRLAHSDFSLPVQPASLLRCPASFPP